MREKIKPSQFEFKHIIHYFEHVDFVGTGPNARQNEWELKEEEVKQAQRAKILRKKEEVEQARLEEIQRRENEAKRIAIEEAERKARIRKEAEARLNKKLQNDYLNVRKFYKEELSS